MTEYHVGCGATGIFAGRINKIGNRWVEKSDVTDEALIAVAQFLLEHEEAVRFESQGKRYKLSVTSSESEET